MSNIVLSASVRQNLLSLQSTADLLATTQSRLATGKKVNSALDNPTNYFTAASLDARASDINNLLDGIGNGVQILQAANTGISSLQKLIDSAKSVANQALQSAVGYSPKSSVTSQAVAGATAGNLLGSPGAYLDASFAGAAATGNTLTAYVNATTSGAVSTGNTLTAYSAVNATAGGQLYSAAATPATGTTLLSALTTAGGGAQAIANNDTLTINGITITFQTGNGALTGTGTTRTLGIDTSLDDLAAALNTLQGGGATSSVTGGAITLNTGTAADLAVTGSAGVLNALGLGAGAANTATRGGGAPTTTALASTTLLSGAATPSNSVISTAFIAGDTLTVNGQTLTFMSTGAAGANQINVGDDVTTLLSKIDGLSGGTGSSIAGGVITLNTGTTANLVITSSNAAAFNSLGFTGGGVSQARGGGAPTTAALAGTTLLSGAASPTNSVISTAFQAGDTLTVSGQTLTFVASGAAGANQINVTDDVTTLLSKIDGLSGGTGSTVTAGAITLHTGITSDLAITSSRPTALTALGLGTGVTQARGGGATTLGGLTLTIPATSQGTATNITFGTGMGQVNTLNQLNAALAPNLLLASIDTTGRITIATTNDAASETIGALGGTAAAGGAAFNGLTANAPVLDPQVQIARGNLVSQYNKIIEQITTTSQDSSFNGINLLAGDTLKLVFNETGKSTLNIQGVNFTPAGLGLGSLTSGTDFIDNNTTNTIMAALNNAGTSLRSQAAALGSNLSIVQIRQEFSKNLINVLQTGSANLTLADTNEEAANSQALSTRQSIAVSALALANQSQQSVLQLLRT